MKKSVFISIQPYYVFLIIAKSMGWNISQEKTIEVRKTIPKATDWDRNVVFYCSNNRKSFKEIPKQYQPTMGKFLDKVIGEFVCDYITENKRVTAGDVGILHLSCLSALEYLKYANNKPIFCWHISDLKIYDKPKELQEFYKIGAETIDELEDRVCEYCIRTDRGENACYGTPNGPIYCEGAFCDEAYKTYLEEENFVLIKPPQSWCYIANIN